MPVSGFAMEAHGEIVDAASGDPLAARLYIESSDGKWFHAESQSDEGSAMPYSKIKSDDVSETHTSLSAHPFVAALPPGNYTVRAARGKEYREATVEITVGSNSVSPAGIILKLERWIDMASLGWYSGETHVHRSLDELPNLVIAEDLNVALPLTAWVKDSLRTPAKHNENRDPMPPAKLIEVDETHVIWPINTEYEIFSVEGKRHTLGAVFILNHQSPLELAAPPVGPIAQEARRQGALLDLDKHNWPWSMMLLPIMDVDLYELTNNHIWSTKFQFTDWYPEYAGEYMNVEMSEGDFTERGWIDFGLKNYYALLNCGFDMKPSAGTASGVHPVPLGFGRVYVKIEGAFSYEKWIDGLSAGRSFVSTGPMLRVEMRRSKDVVSVSGVFESSSPLGSIDILVNGDVRESLQPYTKRTESGAYEFTFDIDVALEGGSWIAVRGFEDRADGRPRFAHTAPQHFKVSGKPLRPKQVEVAYLIGRIEEELKRNRSVLDPDALGEYRQALAFYQKLLKTALKE